MNTHHPHTNPLQQIAFDYIMHTGESVFLTGRAGTGKTTFLRQLKDLCPKQMALLAPTGVAAINAGGVTIHSFFQLPFAPYVPVKETPNRQGESLGEYGLLQRVRFSRDRRDLIQSLDLLVIDEVSMVRADVLDAIDAILRYYRKQPSPFGGLQMLFIGDLFQLPPVATHNEWQILSDFYEGPFFFQSKAIARQPPVYIELQTIYRQSDERFIGLLNEVRNNQLTTEGIGLLNSRFIPNFEVPKHEPWITLTTHNRKADELNEHALERLPEKAFQYKAAIKGEFGEKIFPAEETLTLKIGAQVMFLKNDVLNRRYFNGRIGRIIRLDEEEIWVQCDDDDMPIVVKPETWRNVQYSLNRQLQQVEEKELGSFTQYPLRLAWAVTIHKCQGLTFDRVVIDAAAAFSPGQVYVALSRCRSLQGIVLKSAVSPAAVRVDARVQQFSSQTKAAEELRTFFADAQRRYQQNLLSQAFNTKPFVQSAQYLMQAWREQSSTLGHEAVEWAKCQWEDTYELEATAQKFLLQLQNHWMCTEALPETDAYVQQRTKSAAGWFLKKLQKQLQSLKQLPVVIDSKEMAEELEETLTAVIKAGRQWEQLLQACENGLSPIALVKAKSKVNIADVVGIAYSGSAAAGNRSLGSPHPILEEQLRHWRNSVTAATKQPVYTVCTNKSLTDIATYLPQSEKELLQIKGFGPAKAKRYGEAILALVQSYCQQNQVAIEAEEKPANRKLRQTGENKPAKTDTKQVSYNLWREGKPISEIAAIRGLSTSTIHTHLSHYALLGLVPIGSLMPPSLFDACCKIIADLQPTGMGPVKKILGDEITYGQIRLVMDWMKQQSKG